MLNKPKSRSDFTAEDSGMNLRTIGTNFNSTKFAYLVGPTADGGVVIRPFKGATYELEAPVKFASLAELKKVWELD